MHGGLRRSPYQVRSDSEKVGVEMWFVGGDLNSVLK